MVREPEHPRRLLPVTGRVAVILLTLTAAAAADEAYDRYRQPDRVMAALAVRPGQRVADIGAGSGYFTFRLAVAVGEHGRVVATEVDEGALAVLRKRAVDHPNVAVRKVEPDDPGLEPSVFDLVLLSQVDQYLPDRVAYLERLRPSLAQHGRVAVLNRTPFREALLRDAGRAGYRVVSEVTDLPDHFLVFIVPRRARGK